MTSIAAMTARAWAEVDLAALVRNARTIERVCRTRLLPMVKGDAYGVGAIEVVRALEVLNPFGYGVATLEEAAALRAAGVARPLLVFTPFLPDQLPQFHRLDLRPVIADLPALQAWSGAAVRPFHVEVDTGMARSGFRWDDAEAWSSLASRLPGCEGIFTHFHSAELPGHEVELQWERFQTVITRLPSRPPLVHAANSAAALRGRMYAADMVRPGIFLYGGAVPGTEPEPVVRCKARVVGVRRVRAGESVSYGASWTAPGDITIATLGAGYADGVPRSLSGRGEVELHDRIVPIVGRVTMDFTMVALDGPTVLGDVATLFGGLVSLDRQAEHAGTISYELLTRLGSRIPRLYSGI